MIRCNFLQSLKKAVKGAQNKEDMIPPFTEFFKTLLNIASYHCDYNSVMRKKASPSLFLSNKYVKLKLRVFLGGHCIAMVPWYTKKDDFNCAGTVASMLKGG